MFDNLCVVHSINNAVGRRVLTKKELLKYFESEKTPLNVNYDNSGFELYSVIKYLQNGYNLHFHKIKDKKVEKTGRYIIGIQKPSYKHMIAVVNGKIIDNENLVKRLPTKNKILEVIKINSYLNNFLFTLSIHPFLYLISS